MHSTASLSGWSKEVVNVQIPVTFPPGNIVLALIGTVLLALLSPKGHWPKLTVDNANVNTLNPGDPADMARSTSVHGIEVTVARSLTPLET